MSIEHSNASNTPGQEPAPDQQFPVYRDSYPPDSFGPTELTEADLATLGWFADAAYIGPELKLGLPNGKTIAGEEINALLVEYGLRGSKANIEPTQPIKLPEVIEPQRRAPIFKALGGLFTKKR